MPSTSPVPQASLLYETAPLFGAETKPEQVGIRHGLHSRDHGW